MNEQGPLDFIEFPKMARLNREVVITEKIDGTNAQILISESGDWSHPSNVDHDASVPSRGGDGLIVMAGSRNRWLTLGKGDNAGFAAWVKANRSELVKLGVGRHFGEWWGAGIQRRYGLEEKRFSLFNVGRWGDFATFNAVPPDASTPGVVNLQTGIPGPACCHVVPTLWRGNFKDCNQFRSLEMLVAHGSFAAPGWMHPEGIVIYHEASKKCFKVTVENDESPKSVHEARPV